MSKKQKADREIVVCTAVELKESSLTAAMPDNKADREIAAYIAAKLKENPLTVAKPGHKADRGIVACAAVELNENSLRPLYANDARPIFEALNSTRWSSVQNNNCNTIHSLL